jgi:putative colanic acid biosynthesis acetyltransferase WcaF
MTERSARKALDPRFLPSFSLRNRIGRFAWSICYILLYRTSPRPCFAWRAGLLKLFGAQLGAGCRFYPKSIVWAPWNLICEDGVAVADDAELYNTSRFYLASHASVSQGAYLCGATHDYDDLSFPLLSFPKTIGAYAWICARAIVHPRVNIGTGAILGLGSMATHDLEPFGIYAGVPARKIKERLRSSLPEPYSLLGAELPSS